MTKSELGRALQQALNDARVAFEEAQDRLDVAEHEMEEFWRSLDMPETGVGQMCTEKPKRRGGRKPGSTNKPKEPSKQTDFKPETFANSTAPQEHIQVFNSFEPLPGETMIGLFEQYKWDQPAKAVFTKDHYGMSEHDKIVAFKKLIHDSDEAKL